MIKLPLSVLELVLVEQERSAAEALNSLPGLARRVEELGYRRIWTTEHHGTPFLASATPQVLTAHLTAATSRIRVGSGGVMAPNHAPFALAEQFATLSAISGGRTDLGVGRGPGTRNEAIVRALRRGAEPADEHAYRADVAELLSHLGGESGITLLPGENPAPEPWLLAASPAGAELAAAQGLPLAFGHHLQPGNTVEAVERYREHFRPSKWRAEPYVLLSVQTICAATDAEAAYLAGPWKVLTAQLLEGTSVRARFLPAVQAAAYAMTPEIAAQVQEHCAHQAFGDRQTVTESLPTLAHTAGADELMLVTPIYEAQTRISTYELVAAH
ncbi:LLM class flavin-dependent oxidoreductase [Amycolatopsis sp. NPDC051071]|uniref:LLM class flavin-dependent oxidoreductase n=1 Tax=Amycolatopsis sp. NPDC051071 TaxID=3154637 RepID=UPI003433C559